MESVDIINEFFEFMVTDELFNSVKSNSKAFTRKYKMNSKDIICFMLTRGSNNTSVELNKYSNTTGMEPVTRQAYSLSSTINQPHNIQTPQ